MLLGSLWTHRMWNTLWRHCLCCTCEGLVCLWGMFVFVHLGEAFLCSRACRWEISLPVDFSLWVWLVCLGASLLRDEFAPGHLCQAWVFPRGPLWRIILIRSISVGSYNCERDRGWGAPGLSIRGWVLAFIAVAFLTVGTMKADAVLTSLAWWTAQTMRAMIDNSSLSCLSQDFIRATRNISKHPKVGEGMGCQSTLLFMLKLKRITLQLKWHLRVKKSIFFSNQILLMIKLFVKIIETVSFCLQREINYIS